MCEFFRIFSESFSLCAQYIKKTHMHIYVVNLIVLSVQAHLSWTSFLVFSFHLKPFRAWLTALCSGMCPVRLIKPPR
jgi:hypothetical protein